MTKAPLTLIPRAKRYGGGFIPMVTARNARGQCKGAMVHKGCERDSNVCASERQATLRAYFMAQRVVASYPQAASVAVPAFILGNL